MIFYNRNHFDARNVTGDVLQGSSLGFLLVSEWGGNISTKNAQKYSYTFAT